MIPQNRRYFIIIVHYGEPPSTDRAVASLINNSINPNTIVVIDHAERPYQASDHVRVIRPERNRGYGAGLNMGLGILLTTDISRNDIVVCMNNDVSLSGDGIRQLRQWWQQRSENAIIGAVGGVVNLLNGRTRVTKTLQDARHELSYIDGFFLAAPYHVLLKLKGFPEQYFLYWEDILFSQRAKQAGIPLRLVSHLGIIHSNKQFTKPSGDHLYYLVRNGALFLERETSFLWRRFWWLKNRLRFIYHSLRPGHDQTKIICQALRDAIKGLGGQKPT